MRYLRALSRGEPEGLLEVRYRRPAGMGRRFYPAAELPRAARAILALGARTDTYLAVAPRSHPAGGREAVSRVWTLWADLDTPQAAYRVRQLASRPAIVIDSGSAGHLHLYFPLSRPLPTAEAEQANRRLAQFLRADPGAVTGAAALLRPPGTLNFKHTPPAAVRMLRLHARTITAEHLLAGVPALSLARRPLAAAHEHPMALSGTLREIAPEVYAQALTGQQPGRDHKIRCPFHEDRTPSLHLYPTAQQGWCCFGCGRGGDVIHFAAHLWGLSPRSDFQQIAQRLEQQLGLARTRGLGRGR
jgi:hypothetical protein